MKPKLRRQLTGSFRAQELGAGSWLLTRHEQRGDDDHPGTDEYPAAEVFLRCAQPLDMQVLRGAALSDVVLQWGEGAADLTVTAGGRQLSLPMRSAIIHEPLPRLYGALPLATFEETEQRFWRRIFRLIRIPGGRHLLAVLARRDRSTR